jgi:acyl-CoA thioesterase YciA
MLKSKTGNQTMKLISTKICKTSDIGINNNLFGGTMMAWLDEAGGTMASEECCTPNMITLKIDEVLFKMPVKVNEHIRIYGQVERMGTTSISLYLEARRFDFAKHNEELVVSTRAVFVKIDSKGDPDPIDLKIRKKFQQK